MIHQPDLVPKNYQRKIDFSLNGIVCASRQVMLPRWLVRHHMILEDTKGRQDVFHFGHWKMQEDQVYISWPIPVNDDINTSFMWENLEKLENIERNCRSNESTWCICLKRRQEQVLLTERGAITKMRDRSVVDTFILWLK